MNAHQNNKDKKRPRNTNSDIDKAAWMAQLVIGAVTLVLVVLSTVYYFFPFHLR